MGEGKETRKSLLEAVNSETEYYKPHTRNQYFQHLNNFLDWALAHKVSLDALMDKEQPVARETLKKYMAVLQGQGFSQQHINYVIRGPVGALFRAKGLRLPIKLPPLQAAVYDESKNLFWTEEQIERLVAVARLSGAQSAAIMALATVYAPRASEIVGVRPEHIDQKKGVVTIHTVKHNLIRRHLIPEVLQPVFYGYNWPPLSDMRLRELLDELVKRANLTRTRRLSFHGFRHALFDELSYLGYSNEEIYDFTGWVKGTGLTLGFYAHPLKYNPNNDTKIFTKHPFLKYWE